MILAEFQRIECRYLNARRLIAPLLTGLGAVLFVGLSLYRRLNFDESLALRAGWLDLAGEPSAPAFLMPWTLLAGAVGHAIDDPGTVLGFLRLLASGGVAAAFVAAASAAGLSAAEIAGATWLALANGAFLAHALEFRYDAAVLILLLVAFRILVKAGSKIALGAATAILGLHHLKGTFYAAGVVMLLLLWSTDRRRDVGRFLLGATLAGTAWLAIISPLGLLGRFVESLRTYFSLAAASHRAPVGEALGPVLLNDLAWWFLVLAILGRRALRPVRLQGGREDGVAMAVAALGIGFWVVHPHAWAYLAALPVPFLVLVEARALAREQSARRWGTGAAMVGVILQFATGASPPLSQLSRALGAPIAPEVALLRGVETERRPEEKVLDPSGLVYFVPSCAREWYVDTLLVDRVRSGTWMTELARGIPASCTLVLNTYRLNALPPAAREDLVREFVPLASGLAVRRDRYVGQELGALHGTGRIESFW